MSSALKWLWLPAAAAPLLIVLAIPLLTIIISSPGESTRDFYAACTTHLGTRAAIVANPPRQPLSPDEVLLRITTTATKLGFGRQGATVTAAIALEATGLANAANPAAPETLRYAHSTEIRDGAGALGLPLTWASAEELMTPEVSTAIALDRMVDTAPEWRDTDPAALAAQITGRPATDYTDAVAAAQTRIPATLTTTTPTTPSSAGADLAITATTTSTASPSPTPTSSAPLAPSQASSAAKTAPQAAACLSALTTP
ncbi:hypothetical protein BST19_22125, partial [Mycobacterium bouchedurhonense]